MVRIETTSARITDMGTLSLSEFIGGLAPDIAGDDGPLQGEIAHVRMHERQSARGGVNAHLLSELHQRHGPLRRQELFDLLQPRRRGAWHPNNTLASRHASLLSRDGPINAPSLLIEP